jgi:periplasmic protein TonB
VRFQFAVTWSTLYVSLPAPQKSALQSSGARSRAVVKPPGEPDITWAMVVPKMYRPLPRRRRVYEIAPPPRPAPVPEPRRERPRIEVPRLALRPEPVPIQAPRVAPVIEKRIPVQRIFAISGAALAAASLAVLLIRHSSPPAKNQAHVQPQAVAVMKFPAAPVASEPLPQRRAPKRTLESQKPSRTFVAPTRHAPKIAPAPAMLHSAPPAEPASAAPALARTPTRFDAEPFQMDDFQSSLVISKVKPVYPEVARLALVQGTVRLKATIGTDGSVQALELESGPALLAQAAIEAVRQWRFLPATRNGVRVEDVTHVDVSFALVK